MFINNDHLFAYISRKLETNLGLEKPLDFQSFESRTCFILKLSFSKSLKSNATLAVKVYKNSCKDNTTVNPSQREFNNLKKIYNARFCGLVIPKPLLELPEINSFVMEWIDGISLNNLIKYEKRFYDSQQKHLECYFSGVGFILTKLQSFFYQKEAMMYHETRFKSPHGRYVDFIQKTTVLELIGDCKGKRILEIGSGTGRFTKELAKRGAHVVCVDLSRNMHLQSRLNSSEFSNVEYYLMSGTELGFAQESFDLCLTVNVMSHIKNSCLLFKEVSRVLKKNGSFVANFPNSSGFYFFVGWVVNFFNRSLHGPVYSRWYSLDELFYILTSVRLRPVVIIGHLILPKKYCPSFLLPSFRYLDNILSKSKFRILLGDLFVKSYNVVS